MAEDIKILEEFIEAYRIAEEVLDGDIIQSIENLIQRFKVLKAEYKREQYRNELLENKNASLKKEINLMKSLDIPNTMIPKSKVKEKIEEIENRFFTYKMLFTDEQLIEDEIKVLKSLLEES